MITTGNESSRLLKKLGDKELIAKARKFCKKYEVHHRSKLKLADFSTQPKLVLGPEDKPKVKEALQQGIEALSRLQEILYAQDKWSLLVIFQAMDAAGKDGAIKHVMSGVNPQGCQVSSFKEPSEEELDHDFLWRCVKNLPERGRIGIFNRSYYEEVLVVRVHEHLLQKQKLPKSLVTKKIWDERLQDIRNFENYLSRNGTKVIKIFLHVSKEEQKKRFMERIEQSDKNWKFSVADIRERGFWDDYMKAYEEMIKKTSSKISPWYVVPADNKSYARLAVASAIINALDEMELSFPKINAFQIAELEEAKRKLQQEV